MRGPPPTPRPAQANEENTKARRTTRHREGSMCKSPRNKAKGDRETRDNPGALLAASVRLLPLKGYQGGTLPGASTTQALHAREAGQNENVRRVLGRTHPRRKRASEPFNDKTYASCLRVWCTRHTLDCRRCRLFESSYLQRLTNPSSCFSRVYVHCTHATPKKRDAIMHGASGVC